MYDIRRTGSLADAARDVRGILARDIPYAASAALTYTALAAKDEIEAEMPRVFDEPVAYTRNALRTVPSTVQTLTARVAVKDQAGGRGVRPESYLLPEVEGGPRSEKRFERAMRYAGVLQPGERVVPGQEAPLDASGNLTGGVIRMLLRQVQALQRKGQIVAPRRLKKGAGGIRPAYFAGPVGRRGTRGLWLREGRRIKPILVFTKKQPGYRRRLDFVGIAEKVAQAEFRRFFVQAAEALVARRR